MHFNITILMLLSYAVIVADKGDRLAIGFLAHVFRGNRALHI